MAHLALALGEFCCCLIPSILPARSLSSNFQTHSSHELGVVLGQRLVGDKTNEIPEIIPLLEALTLTGKLVTVDALHTQRDTAQVILEKGGPI